MKTLTINLPDNIDEREVEMIVTATLFDRAILSSGQVVNFVDIPKRESLKRLATVMLPYLEKPPKS